MSLMDAKDCVLRPLIKLVKNFGIETDDSIFSDIDDPFEQIHTPYLLEKFVSEHLNYVVSYSKYCIYTKVYASNSIRFLPLDA